MWMEEEYLIPSCLPGDKSCWRSTKDPIINVNQRLYPELYKLCKEKKTFESPGWKKNTKDKNKEN